MADVFTQDKRSSIMANVKGRNTKPELVVRSIIHRMGFRYRLHVADLPGKPDIVLPRHKKVIFVNGCFWHGHKDCPRAKRPTTNTSSWDAKLDENILRDKRNVRKLKKDGWHTLTIWECEIKDRDKIYHKLSRFLQ